VKHIFVINPAAGNKNSATALSEKLNTISGIDKTVHVSTAPKEIVSYVRDYCENHPGEEMRFYACGGDGTLNEVLNGMIGYGNASLTSYPCGTGNDYVKYYGGADRFLDIAALVHARDEKVDVMRVNDIMCSINVVDFGFDYIVADNIMRIKRKPLRGGKVAYAQGVLIGFMSNIVNKGKITVDGEVINPDGKLLLCTVANGTYVGSMFKCAPRSINNDGLMEVSMIKPISRRKMLGMIPKYIKGEHLSDPACQDLVEYRRARKITVEADEPIGMSLDGEGIQAEKFEIENLQKAVKFAVPV
jgi:diacylglycerol kinase (ATP)